MYFCMEKPGNAEVTFANLPFILLVAPVQRVLIDTVRGEALYEGPDLTFWP